MHGQCSTIPSQAHVPNLQVDDMQPTCDDIKFLSPALLYNVDPNSTKTFMSYQCEYVNINNDDKQYFIQT